MASGTNMAGERPSWLGRVLLGTGLVLFFHAAYSIWEFYSFAKSVDLTSVASNLETRIPIDMSIEAVVAFILLVLGCAMTSKQLRGISWSDNMREYTIDRMDARPSFTNMRHRGRVLFGEDT